MKIQNALAASAVFVAGVFPQIAAADWVYRPSNSFDDQGSALVRNDQGYTLDVGCAPDGTTVLSVCPRPPATAQMSHPMFNFVVDGGRPLRLPVDCSASGCTQSDSLGGQRFPVQEIQAITSALRAGRLVTVQLGGQDILQFPLAGSSAALGRMKANAGCDGL